LLLDVVDDGLVLEDAAVVLESGSSVAFKAQLRADLCPVKLEGGASL
jgi:hypothetical protein